MNQQNSSSPAQPKKERTSVLELIRRRTGLLVGIVGLALLIFILETLLGSGASIFGSDEMIVGRINGRKVDRVEFMNRLEMQLNNYRARNQGREVDDQVRGQAIDGLWNQYVVDYAIKPQFDKIGIQVGEDELYERVVMNPVQSIIQNLSDQNGRVNEQFARPDGTLDLAKWRAAVQNVTGESEMAVKQMEDNVLDTRRFEKFRSLVNKGLYITKAEAERNFDEHGTQFEIEFVVKKFTDMPDADVKITDADVEKYYNAHSYEFRNKEASRKLEFVTFNVTPSPEDMQSIEKEANRVAEELKGKSMAEDSMILAQESENGSISMRPMTRKTMVIRDSSVYTAAPGTVYGPYNEGAYFKVYKLEKISSVADSAKVRHILIGLTDQQSNQPKRSKAEAKKIADSLLTLIKDKKVTFDTLVKTMSDDLGSRNIGGDYGWFDENKNFVTPFKNAGLTGKKGDLTVVETEFGYHIIEVVDVSEHHHPSYLVAEVFKPIAASDETNQKIFARASQFGGENNSAEKFDKAVEEQKLTKRLADNVKEGDRQIPGLETGKDIVRWAFNAKKGDVSVFSYSDKHVVVKLAAIKEKGTLPLDAVRDEITSKVINDKKASIFTEEFNKKAAGSKTAAEYAARLGLTSRKQPNANFRTVTIDGVGPDNIMSGTAVGTGKGNTSKVTTGDNGVFVLTVLNVQITPNRPDPNEMRRQDEMELTGRTDFEVFNAVKELADIEDHKSKID